MVIVTPPSTRVRRLALVLALSVAGAACGADGDPTGTAPTDTVASSHQAADRSCRGSGTTEMTGLAYREIEGVAPNSVSLDLFAPALADDCAAAPIVVYVHGGGFRNGDKGNKISDKVALFNEAGWVFVSVNYRLVGDPAAGPAGAAHPTQAQDLAAAVGWLVDHAEDFGGDPEKIALMGHSAGAFLVAQQGADPTYLVAEGVDPEALRCVVALDTETFAISDQINGGGSQEAAYRETFGDDPAVWDQASPQTGAEAGTATSDFLMVTRGAAVRSAGNQRFAEAPEPPGSTRRSSTVSRSATRV